MYDGDSNSAAMIGKYCGQANPPNFITSSSTAFIHFHSDALKFNMIAYLVASVRLLNFSLGYTKLVTPTGKYQHTLRKL